MISLSAISSGLVVAACLCLAAPSEPIAEKSLTGSGNPGQASHYGGNWKGGNCGFATYNNPAGIFGAAISDANWYNAGNCGACLAVTGPKGNGITAMVVDKCPGCGENFLNIFEQGYKELAPQNFVDKIDVTWNVVSCNFNTPLTVQNKEGTSQYWFSMQVQNSNWPVDTLDVSTDGGQTWQPTVSRDYNFFENPNGGGFGADTVDLRISCFNNKKVYMRGVTVESNKKIYATENC